MHKYLIDFYETVKNKYKESYFEIDRLQKGYIDLDDIIDYIIMKDIENNQKKYDSIKTYATEVHQVLMIVSNTRKIYLKHFLAFSSVFEHNKGDSLDLMDKNVIFTLKEQILELKELFGCYSDKKLIDLRSILCEIKFKDKITKCRKFVESEKIDFSRFLLCLPFFVWMYNEINSMV